VEDELREARTKRAALSSGANSPSGRRARAPTVVLPTHEGSPTCRAARSGPRTAPRGHCSCGESACSPAGGRLWGPSAHPRGLDPIRALVRAERVAPREVTLRELAPRPESSRPASARTRPSRRPSRYRTSCRRAESSAPSSQRHTGKCCRAGGRTWQCMVRRQPRCPSPGTVRRPRCHRAAAARTAVSNARRR
jgi:hypothetical protein